MRKFILIIFLIVSCFALAQDSSLTREYSFCGVKKVLLADCRFEEKFTTYNGRKIRSGASIHQKDQFVHWTNYYFIPDPVKFEFAQQNLTKFLLHCEENMGGYRKKPMKFVSIGKELDGWMILIKDKEKKNTCFLFVTGIINSKHLIIYCGLEKKPKNNQDIPSFVRQIIEFK